ncbi:hypothetical protein FE257_010322 [Aspergillus nanangensis]|uniref:Uncharacterized protein n=1 Tax=Aspergillus nanangensis TaxID=2582783 RepID=A0AAD4CKM2_ASPNN|nr:hypothetical protein FE257_010322 [Aspergillus nanangensis]
MKFILFVIPLFAVAMADEWPSCHPKGQVCKIGNGPSGKCCNSLKCVKSSGEDWHCK